MSYYAETLFAELLELFVFLDGDGECALDAADRAAAGCRRNRTLGRRLRRRGWRAWRLLGLFRGGAGGIGRRCIEAEERHPLVHVLGLVLERLRRRRILLDQGRGLLR